MKTMKQMLSVLLFSILLNACQEKNTPPQASGNFEADELIISAEAAGQVLNFTPEEGMLVKPDESLGLIDTIPLYLKKKQLLAQISAIESKLPDSAKQLAILQEQIKTAEREKNRITQLVKAEAVPAKQLDDVEALLATLHKQLEAQQAVLNTQTIGTLKEVEPLKVQIEQINDQISKCHIHSPINGTVLSTYVHRGELTTTGKPLFRISDLNSIYLRAFVSGDQLGKLKLGQNIKVLTDNGDNGIKEHQGKLIWINDKAEFTPKTIQTKEERKNMVYAVKVKVSNQGDLKIGMYGELSW